MATRSEEIEREIEETRRDMTRTVGAIERRLSPDGMMDGAMSWLRESPKGRALVDDVTDVVSRNPLPIVLIGIGLGWLAWEMTNGGRRKVGRYRPMRDRLGPDYPVERHHMHVEDGGSSAYGRSPDPEELVGYRHGTESAAQAAEAFRDMDRGSGASGGNGVRTSPSGITGTGPYRPAGIRSGSTTFPRAGEPGGAGYGPSVTPANPKPASNLGTTAGAAGSAGTTGTGSTGMGSTGSGSSSPDPQKLTGYDRSGEKASDAAKAFEEGKSGSGTASTGATGASSPTGAMSTNRSAGATGSGMSDGTIGTGTSTGTPGTGAAGTSTAGSSSADADKAFKGDGSSTGTTGPGTSMTDNSKRFGGLGTDLPGSTGKDRT